MEPFTPTEAFLNQVRTLSYHGFSFVPLIGSGISADSGILTGENFTSYLASVVYSCVSLYRAHEDPEIKEERTLWRLKDQGWPDAVPDAAEVRRWIFREFVALAKRTGFSEAKDLIESKGPKPRNYVKNEIETLDWPLVPRILVNNDNSKSVGLYNQTLLGISKRLKILRQELNHPDGTVQTSPSLIAERAVRSLYDWRATLLFLSSLRLEMLDKKPFLSLASPDQTIIDWFNTHITDGRKPNLAHNMLAHLSRPLRFRTILTTNFDQLIEEAFLEARQPLHAFDVSRDGRLPDPRSVQAKDCVIKLHGTITETRADFSLDSNPSESDIQTFQKYIFSDNDAVHQRTSRHLIVAGISARDVRITNFLLRSLHRNTSLRIFWVCYNQEDVTRVAEVFKDAAKQVVITKSPRVDLLLYELYQRCTLSLPPGGFSFTFSHKVPPTRHDRSRVAKLKVSHGLHARWAADINRGKRLDESPLKGAKVHILRHDNGYYTLSGDNIISHAVKLQHSLEDLRLNCIWIEMADDITPQTMLHEILITLALRRGLFQLHHVDLMPKVRDGGDDSVAYLERLSNLVAVLGVNPEEWVLLLYGRTTPGASSGWKGGGWTRSHDYKGLEAILKRLGRVWGGDKRKGGGGLGFKIVYMPFTKDRMEQQMKLARAVAIRACDIADVTLSEEQNKEIENSENPFDLIWPLIAARKLASETARKNFCDFHKDNGLPFPTKDNVPELSGVHAETKIPVESVPIKFLVENWLNPRKPFLKMAEKTPAERWQMLQFLYGLALFRQSRHPNAILSEAVFRCPHRFKVEGKDNDWERDVKTGEWISCLRSEDVLLDKPGGYVWMYRDTRISILRLIEAQCNWQVPMTGGDVAFNFASQLRGRMHEWIADWYFKAFCATGHITPFLESLHHRYLSMQFVWYGKRSSQRLDDPATRHKLLRDRILGYHKSLNMIVKSCKMAKPWLEFWLSESATIAWFELRGGANLPSFRNDALEACVLAGKDEGVVVGDSFQVDLTERISGLRQEVEWIAEDLRDSAARGKKHIRISVSRPDGRTEDGELPYSLLTSELQGDDFQKNLLSLMAKYDYKCFARGAAASVSFLSCNAAEIAEARRAWLFKNLCNQGNVFIISQILTEFAYLHVKRAKVQSHARNIGADGARVCDRWVQVCMICYESLQLFSHLDSSFAANELLLQIKTLTLYGLSLGHLGRYFEAHRRLNEAEALLSKKAIIANPLELAKIKLRRAEICILEAEEAASCSDGDALDLGRRRGQLLYDMLGPRAADPETLQRIRLSKIEDAWILLDCSMRLLSGKSHSSLWWGRQYCLTLRLFSILTNDCERRSVPLSRVRDPEPYVWNIFSKAQLVADGDRYLQLRLIDYGVGALSALESCGFWVSEHKATTIRSYFAAVSTRKPEIAPGTLLDSYMRRVQTLLDSWKQ